MDMLQCIGGIDFFVSISPRATRGVVENTTASMPDQTRFMQIYGDFVIFT